MAKKIKKTEKDTKSWKERWEGANKALLEMVTERTLLEKQLDLQVKQNKQLQNLCRALQQQLTEIRNKDKNKPGKLYKFEIYLYHFPLHNNGVDSIFAIFYMSVCWSVCPVPKYLKNK